MTDTVWIKKNDGTLQCYEHPGVSVEDMKTELEALGAKVLAAEKRQDCQFVTQMCGAPTGNVNAYEISRADWEAILNGVVGPMGFSLWTCGSETTGSYLTSKSEIPWSLVAEIVQNSSVRYAPVLIRDLIGRPCRCYSQGDQLSKDYRPDRVNIEIEKDGNRITDIWFG